MNPFGAGVPRFDYQKQPVKKSEQIANNGMISVKDKDIEEKRQAFQRTIELHRRLNSMRPNAVFTSNVKRDTAEGSTSSDQGATAATFNSHNRTTRVSS